MNLNDLWHPQRDRWFRLVAARKARIDPFVVLIPVMAVTIGVLLYLRARRQTHASTDRSSHISH